MKKNIFLLLVLMVSNVDASEELDNFIKNIAQDRDQYERVETFNGKAHVGFTSGIYQECPIVLVFDSFSKQTEHYQYCNGHILRINEVPPLPPEQDDFKLQLNQTVQRAWNSEKKSTSNYEDLFQITALPIGFPNQIGCLKIRYLISYNGMLSGIGTNTRCR